MHTIPPHETAVTLLHRSGAVRHFDSKAHALKALGSRFISFEVGPEFKVASERPYYHNGSFDGQDVRYAFHDYVMRDDFGGKIVYADFADLFRSSPINWWARRYGTFSGVGPVPGSGRRRSHRGTYYRRPKTTRDRRWAQTVDHEYEVPPRPSRTHGGLPHAWDDFVRDDFKDKSWKSYRKSQHKAQTPSRLSHIFAPLKETIMHQ